MDAAKANDPVACPDGKELYGSLCGKPRPNSKSYALSEFTVYGRARPATPFARYTATAAAAYDSETWMPMSDIVRLCPRLPATASRGPTARAPGAPEQS